MSPKRFACWSRSDRPVAFRAPRAELRLRHLRTRRIRAAVQFCANLQTSTRSHGDDQIDDDVVVDEGSAAPVLRDVAEHTMFDLIPLAGPRRKWLTRGSAAFASSWCATRSSIAPTLHSTCWPAAIISF